MPRVKDKNKIAPTFGTVPACDKFERDVTPTPIQDIFDSVFKNIIEVMNIANELKKKSTKKVNHKLEIGGPVPINFVIQDVREPHLHKRVSKSIIIPGNDGKPLLDPVIDKEIIDLLINKKNDDKI